MTLRTLHSTSTYVDGWSHKRDLTIDIPVDADADAIDELLQPESGAGHFGPNGESVDAYYEITSIDGLKPRIHWDASG